MPDTTSKVEISSDVFTPSGKLRLTPVLIATITNGYLNKTASLKSQSHESNSDFQRRVALKVSQWNAQAEKDFARKSIAQQKAHASQSHESLCEENAERLSELENILKTTLLVDDKIQWDDLEDRRVYHEFWFSPRPERIPNLPQPTPEKVTLLDLLLPPLKAKKEKRNKAHFELWERHCSDQNEQHQRTVASWESQRNGLFQRYSEEKNLFEQQQQDFNEALLALKHLYELGEPDGIERYLDLVFSRSSYPDHFPVTHVTGYQNGTAVVDVELPPPSQISDTKTFKLQKTKNTSDPIPMRPKEFEVLYDSSLKRTVLRTIHEIFEADYHPWIETAVVNGWVTSIDPATGIDKTNCVISVSARREEFVNRDLRNIDIDACIRSLKGQIAGPLSSVTPVVPILKLDTSDARFIESEAVLAEWNSMDNLAEMPWEEFEHLVREVFEKEFAAGGGEVKVTRASSDGGVDAIAFDPDPIRGGKFVIQAKRYTKVVPVSAVRDLYGTMISEGATRGILVTTAHYGSDSLEFSKNKPITLITGSNLVHMLEKHGHKVRIDIQSAKKRA